MLLFILSAAICMLLATIGYLCFLKLTGNFHEIVPKVAYRSARLTSDQLRQHHEKKQFRSIINLLGDRSGVAWYRDQTAWAASLGIAHFDFRIDPSEELPKDRALELVELMRAAPKPVLIHCKAGADRAGLATALFLSEVSGSSKKTAGNAISLRYGHVSLPRLSSSNAVRKSWQNYET